MVQNNSIRLVIKYIFVINLFENINSNIIYYKLVKFKLV
jgi:hypothetical protein